MSESLRSWWHADLQAGKIRMSKHDSRPGIFPWYLNQVIQWFRRRNDPHQIRVPNPEGNFYIMEKISTYTCIFNHILETYVIIYMYCGVYWFWYHAHPWSNAILAPFSHEPLTPPIGNYKLGFEWERISKLLKRTLRITANCEYNAHTEPLFTKLHIQSWAIWYRN